MLRMQLISIVALLELIGFVASAGVVYSFKTHQDAIEKDYDRIKHSRQQDQRIIGELTQRVASLSSRKMVGAPTFDLEVTAYTASADETDDTPDLTAFMEKPIPGKICAVSRDLKKYGKKLVYIEGVGIRRVADLMNKRKHRSVDLLVKTKKKARKFGKQNLKVIVLN